ETNYQGDVFSFVQGKRSSRGICAQAWPLILRYPPVFLRYPAQPCRPFHDRTSVFSSLEDNYFRLRRAVRGNGVAALQILLAWVVEDAERERLVIRSDPAAGGLDQATGFRARGVPRPGGR